MTENTDEILRAIKERVNNIGWETFSRGDESPEKTPWATEKRLHLWVKSKDEANSVLSLDVGIGSSYLRIAFGCEDKPEQFKDPNKKDKMLDYIEDYLLTTRVR